MTLVRRHEANGTMAVLMVIPAHESFNPGYRFAEVGEGALGIPGVDT